MVDIGSNSVRLVVYEQLNRAPFPRFNEKSLCRLGDGLGRTGILPTDGFARTLEATRRFRAIADAMDVQRIDVQTDPPKMVRGRMRRSGDWTANRHAWWSEPDLGAGTEADSMLPTYVR